MLGYLCILVLQSAVESKVVSTWLMRNNVK